ncbi:MAG: hypothetical protein JJ916_11810 [Phycisphaerales bacterium]|nr:hypothetical protein [Phycisphaerales bacterium]
MLPRTTTLWACVIAAGSATAHADIFTWFTNSGMWEDHNMWNGPAGQYPDSILDTATISGSQTSATLSQNLALGTLNVLNGAAVYSAGNSIFVNADTIVSGIGSSLSVTETTSLRDFDTDTLTLDGDGILAMYGGLAQFDDALLITDGAVLGAGIIEMNSTTGNLVIEEGALWITDGVGPHDTLRVTRTDSSTSKLDWTSPSASIIAWDEKTLINELPYTGPLGGKIHLSSYAGDCAFESTHGFIGAASSEFVFVGDDPNQTARLTTPFLDSYGQFRVWAGAFVDTPILAMRGDMIIHENAHFRTNANLINFHSFEIDAQGDNTIVQFSSGQNSTISFKDGDSNIVMGPGSRFDLDGSGQSVVNIEDDASVWIEAEFLDYTTQSPFNGTFNIEGTLHVEPVNGRFTWNNYGEINLTQGEITGRGIINDGIIRGTGSIEGSVNNNGEIIADGGTLQLGQVTMDGQANAGTGVIRAQTGDIVMNMQANGGDQYFTGSIYVGDGIGIREVLNADVNLWLREIDGVRGLLELNSGFVALHDFHSSGDTMINGESLLRVTGNNGEDRISFVSGSVTTINGTLEADGNTWFVEGAQVNGSGTLDIVSTVKGIYFQDGADLGNVSLESSGGVYLSDLFDAQASVHALTLRNTASLNISMWYSQQQDQILNDKLTVNDHAILDGELILSNFPESELPAGQTVTILEAASIEGEFDAIDFSELGTNRRAFVTITDTTVEVFVTCFADINADGEADFFDASEFMTLFNQQDPLADMNEDGQFNFFDVSAFLSAYDLGC